jgi:hypothetical protein
LQSIEVSASLGRAKLATKPSNSKNKRETAAQQAGRSRRLKTPQPGRAVVPRHHRFGVGSRIPNNAKEALQLAFEGIGGVKALTIWAKANSGDFYTKLWARLIPRDVQLGTDGSLEELLAKLEEAKKGTVPGDYVEVIAEKVT